MMTTVICELAPWSVCLVITSDRLKPGSRQRPSVFVAGLVNGGTASLVRIFLIARMEHIPRHASEALRSSPLHGGLFG